MRRGLLRRHHDFRSLWCGETTGRFGTAVSGVAMPLIAVSDLAADPFDVALLSATAWAPWLLIGLPVGAWVDRLPHRPVMLGAVAVSLLGFAAVPVAGWLGLLGAGLLMGVSFTTGVAAVFFQTAYTAYLPGLLQPEDLPEGNAKLHGSASAARIAGLSAGGAIAQVAGAVNGLLVSTAASAVSLLCLFGIRHRELRVTGNGRRFATVVGAVRDGLRLTMTDPWFRTFTLFGSASNLALTGYQSIQVVFLVRVVGLPAGLVGVLIAVTGAGGITGAFVARWVADRVGTARAVIFFEVAVPVLGLLMPATFGGAGLVLFAVGGFAVAAGAVAGNVIRAGFQQRYCPPHLLGRLTASTAFLSYGSIPLGALLGGVLASVFDVRTAMVITTAGIPLAGLVLWFSPVGATRDLPTARICPDGTDPGQGW